MNMNRIWCENEIYWYTQNVDKPWVIGETAVPADNDSVPYSNQVEFARKTLQMACDCGASGYAWWQFKDVQWSKFHPRYMGVLSMDGSSTNSAGAEVHGATKPVGNWFKQQNVKPEKDGCRKPYQLPQL